MPDEHRRAQVDASVAQRGVGAEKIHHQHGTNSPSKMKGSSTNSGFFRGYLMIGGIDQAKYGLNQFFVWVFVIQRPRRPQIDW